MANIVQTKVPIKYRLREDDGILMIKITTPLTADDFALIGGIIDEYYEKFGALEGIVLNAKRFPRWTDNKNLREHINFVQNYHQKVDKVALAISGFFVKLLAMMARRKVHPQVKVFSHKAVTKARHWIYKS